MNDNKCPCKDCICVPICRHKRYIILLSECDLLQKYIPNYDTTHRGTEKVLILQKILKPTEWKHGNDGYINLLTHGGGLWRIY